MGTNAARRSVAEWWPRIATLLVTGALVAVVTGGGASAKDKDAASEAKRGEADRPIHRIRSPHIGRTDEHRHRLSILYRTSGRHSLPRSYRRLTIRCAVNVMRVLCRLLIQPLVPPQENTEIQVLFRDLAGISRQLLTLR